MAYTENKYLRDYYEYQIRYLDAKVSQWTPVLKTQFLNPAVLTYTTDILNIYTVSDVNPLPFQNSINLTNMVCTFLPLLSLYHQYSVGQYSPCYKNTATTPISYYIPAPYGNLASVNILLQIR